MVTFRTDDDTRWGVGKGANLDAGEVDRNFWELLSRLVALEINPAEPNEIASFTVSGSQMTVNMADGSTHGPLTLPTAFVRFRSDWTAATAYFELDLVTVPDDGLYLVLADHESGAAFDPVATDGDSNQLYRYLLPMGSGGGGAMTLPELTDVWSDIAPTAGNVLTFDGTAWDALTPSVHINNLGGVINAAGATQGQILVFDPDGSGSESWWVQDLPAGGGSGASVSDEGVAILAAPTDINFAGAGVLVTDDGDGTVTVTIDGGGGGGAAALGDLTDVTLTAPADGDFLRFNGAEWVNAAIAWADIDGVPAVVAGLPAALGSDGQVLKMVAGAVAWAADATGAGGGSTTFVGLDDTPAALGTGGQFVAVNAGGTALEFVDPAAGGGAVSWNELTDKPATFAPEAHSHTTGDITDFVEAVQDTVGALIVAGSNVTVTYDDAAGTFTIAAAGGGGGGGAAAEFHGALVHRATDLALNAGTTTIQWSAATYDTDAIFAAGTPSRLTVPAGASRVRLVAGFDTPSAGSATCSLSIVKNGEGFPGRVSQTVTISTSGSKTVNVASAVLDVVPGDYFETSVYTGTAFSIEANGASFFALEVVEGDLLAGGGAAALDELTDVTIAAPETGHFIGYDGAGWVNMAVDWSDLANVPATFPAEAHTHTAGDISDFAEALDDRVAALLVAGTNITLTYDDAAGTMTIAAAGGAGGGAATFLDLTDTPAAFGTAGQVVAVNGTADGLVFTTPAEGAEEPSVTLATSTATALSSSAFATKGAIYDVASDIVLRSITLPIDGDATATYKVVVAVVSGDTAIIDEIVGTSATQATPTAADYTFDFDDVFLRAGQRIAALVVRTDGAATAVAEVHFPSAVGASNGDLTYFGSSRYASNNPTVGDVTEYDNVACVRMTFSYVLEFRDAPADGTPYARQDNGWLAALPEAPINGGVYGRKDGEWTYLNLPAEEGAYRYWRVRLTSEANGGYAGDLFLTEIQFRSVPATVEPASTNPGSVIQSGFTAGGNTAYPFDGTVGSGNYARATTPFTDKYIGYVFDTAKVVREFTSYYNSTYTSNLMNFAVEASEDGVAWFEVLNVSRTTRETASWGITPEPTPVPWSQLSDVPATFTPTTEDVQDIVGAMVVAGANMTVTYDDAAGTLTLDAAGAGAGSTLDALSDVDVTTAAPTDGQALVWNDGAGLWVPGTVAAAGGGDVEGVAGYSQWRIRILNNYAGTSNGCTLQELQFRSVAGVPEVPTGGTPTNTTAPASGSIASAFDGSTATSVFLARQDINTVRIGYDFPAEQVVAEVALWSSAGNPKDIQIEAATGDGIYTTIRNVTLPNVTSDWVVVPLTDDPPESITGTAHTVTAIDAGKFKKTTNAAAVTITVNPNTNSAGDELTIYQEGAGLVSWVAGAGTTIRSRGSALASAGQYAVMGLKFISATEAVLFGDVA